MERGWDHGRGKEKRMENVRRIEKGTGNGRGKEKYKENGSGAGRRKEMKSPAKCGVKERGRRGRAGKRKRGEGKKGNEGENDRAKAW